MTSWTCRMKMAICCSIFGVLAAVTAQAQSRFAVTDTPKVTVGSNVSAGNPGYEGYIQGTLGSISTAATFDGYTIVAFADYIKGGKVGGYFTTILKISGFSADPGINWLNNAQVNGVAFTPAGIGYSYSNGVASWRLNGAGPAFLKASPASTVITHAGQGADLGLRFQVLRVDYAPPGQHSSVNYNNSTMQGTSTSSANSWSSNLSYSVSLESGASLAGLLSGTVTGTYSSSYTQATDANSSVAIGTTTTSTNIIMGPASSAAGVDHNYDVVWVWLNPIASYIVGPSEIRLTGYEFNMADNTQQLEVVPLYVYWLKNPSTIPADVAARLARGWDTSGLGGLTVNDYAQILAADPFSNSTYNPSTDAGHRFDMVMGQTFNYEPPPPGGQPITENFSVATQTTSSTGQGASTTNSTGWSLNYQTSANVLAKVSASFKVSNTYTTTDKWSSAINSATGKTASFSITGPATADNYTGPAIMQVWRDNVFGSFMFVPVR